MRLKKVLSILLCLCLFLPGAACAEQQEAGGRIGIISAMENEVELLLSEAVTDHVDTIGGVEFHVGTLCGQDVVIARAGIGKVLAAAGAATMLSHYPVSSLIFTGIAGGVGDETKLLDMVIATELVQHDYGSQSQAGFRWNAPYIGSGTGYSFSDETLVEEAYAAAVQVVGEEHVFKGLIATGDQFIASEAYVEFLQEEFGAIACEMEGASVAAVCEQYGIPFVVIRAMSDKADGIAQESIENIGDLAADRSGRVVMKMLENLSAPAAEDSAERPDSGMETAYADKLFDRKVVHRIDVRLTDGDWTDLLSNPTDKTKYTAEIVIDGEVFSNVTFSTKGYSSLYFVAYGEEESRRYSFKVNFGNPEEGRTYYGLDKLNLNNLFCDNTWMKDLISYDLFRDAGVEAPLVSYVWLTINGNDQGLYMAVEEIEEGYLNRVYQGEGVIYSVEGGKAPGTVTPEMVAYVRENGFSGSSESHGADLVYSGENLSNYTDIVDHAETSAHIRDHRQVVAAIRALSGTRNNGSSFDVDEIIRFFAAHNYLLNFDSYTGSQLNNLMLHEKDGVVSVIPWDYNLAFGTYPTVIGFEVLEDATALLNLGIDTPLIHATEESRPLWNLIRSHPEYLDRYHEVLSMLLKEHLSGGRYEAKVDRVRELLLPWIRKDPTAFCSAEEFEEACETLKEFLTCRTESVRRQLAGELSTVSEEQEKQAMADASGISILNMGALVLGMERISSDCS